MNSKACMRIVIIFIVILLTDFESLSADTFYLKEGGKVAGEVIEETSEYLRVKTSIAIITVNKEDVAERKEGIDTELPDGIEKEIEKIKKLEQKKIVTSVDKASEQPKIKKESRIERQKIEEDKEVRKVIDNYLDIVTMPAPDSREEGMKKLKEFASLFDFSNFKAPQYLLSNK